MAVPKLIYEINTRVWLRRFGAANTITLADVPERELEDWAELGVDAVWLMGVWSPSPESGRAAREHPGLQKGYARALPDWSADDVGGSPYAIRGYDVNPSLGGPGALAELRKRLACKGIKLLLDFIPNHTARDHQWVHNHPDWYIQGGEDELAAQPGNYFRVETAGGSRILAHGRDPYFAGWTDTAQLDYARGETQARMRGVLNRLALLCDGVRCDMAMLVIADVFAQTWRRPITEFWPRAIAETRRVNPDFCFVAEVYWGREPQLVEMGFDLVYDKSLLDRVVSGEGLVREQFDQPPAYHRQWLRFLENHDEPRIAARLNTLRVQAAAAWIYALPSAALILDGQMDGARVRLPVQLTRGPVEAEMAAMRRWYRRLLRALRGAAPRKGAWTLLLPASAWNGNDSCRRILGQGYDHGDLHLRVFVNWSDTRSQCWVPLELGSLHGKEVELRDELSGKVYLRDGLELTVRGLYLDMEPWECHVFDCIVRDANSTALLPD